MSLPREASESAHHRPRYCSVSRQAEPSKRFVKLQITGQCPQCESNHLGLEICWHVRNISSAFLAICLKNAVIVICSTSQVPVASPQGAPPARGLASLTAVGSALYLFAGAPQRGAMLADLWRLDTSQPEGLAWERLHPGGPTPHPRCSHTAAAVGSSIVFHGGSFYRCSARISHVHRITGWAV